MRLQLVPQMRPDGILVVHMPHSIGDSWHTNALDTRQALGQDIGIFLPLLVEFRELFELFDADRCGDVGHAAVVADGGVLVTGLLAVVAQALVFGVTAVRMAEVEMLNHLGSMLVKLPICLPFFLPGGLPGNGPVRQFPYHEFDGLGQLAI